MSRRLTREDRELWERLRSSVKPLRPEESAGASVETEVAEAQAKTPIASPGKVAQAKKSSPRSAPTLSALEQRKLKRLARGLVDVEARIDLHGMRQERAFARLISFLREQQAHDARLVLVITGKGVDGGGEGRGVLKQVVPMWLSRPEFRELIVGFGEAGRRHGGSGALYVQLRRRSRSHAAA
jgi:DNA-nicking Smr family endonuclease